MSDGLRLTRVAGGSLIHVAEMIGAALFFFGALAGLYIAAIAIVTNTCYMITAAWLLGSAPLRSDSDDTAASDPLLRRHGPAGRQRASTVVNGRQRS